MLESFQIRNFRLFHHLEVRKLGRVNLIVGKNNSGKSTFLDAVKIYASNASPTVLLNLMESRQESWISEGQPYIQNFLSHPIRHLFCNHRLPSLGESGIFLGEVSASDGIHITIAAYRSQYDEDDGTMRRVRISNVEGDEELSDVEVVLVVEEGEKTKRLLGLDKDLREARRSYRLIEERRLTEFRYPWQVVPTDNMSNREVAALWDITGLTDLASEVISALRLIDPKVSGVAFVEDISRSRLRNEDNRIPLVKIRDIEEPLPLKSMGDGITRLFHIIVALVNARKGILLVDEFENGLHWSVQPKVWDVVFQLAERLDVQVFATTHSRDCVEGFDSAWNNHPMLGAFFRFEAKNDVIKVTEYTSETLTDAIDMDIEVR